MFPCFTPNQKRCIVFLSRPKDFPGVNMPLSFASIIIPLKTSLNLQDNMFRRNHCKVVSGGRIRTSIKCFGAQRNTVCAAVVFVFLWVELSFHFVVVERRASGNEAESHETLAQRIEKDVVGFDAQTRLCNPHDCSI